MNLKEVYDHQGNHAYIDGSFNTSSFVYGSGVVIIQDNEEIIKKSFSGNDVEVAKLRNVAGEMRAAMYAAKFAQLCGWKSLVIHYDYYGIEKWVTGEWKRNNEFTKKYNEFMNSISKDMQLYFRHVKAHTGDKYNEMADDLAKVGAGI